MARIRLLVVTVVPALFVASFSTAQYLPPGELAPPPPDRSKDFKQGPYYGTVTEITRDSITINGAGLNRIGPVNLITGNRRFLASDALASGDYRKGVSESFGYRLADVRAGDRVSIHFDRIDGVNICTEIGILRRPGGRVPPSHAPHLGSGPRPHESANAHQDWEERGIRLPARFLPLPDLERPALPPVPSKAPARIPLARD